MFDTVRPCLRRLWEVVSKVEFVAMTPWGGCLDVGEDVGKHRKLQSSANVPGAEIAR